VPVISRDKGERKRYLKKRRKKTSALFFFDNKHFYFNSKELKSSRAVVMFTDCSATDRGHQETFVD
jgi:hypothetical protein